MVENAPAAAAAATEPHVDSAPFEGQEEQDDEEEEEQEEDDEDGQEMEPSPWDTKKYSIFGSSSRVDQDDEGDEDDEGDGDED